MNDRLVEALHQPQYTGENRCGACTAINAIIAAILSAIVARKSKFAAVVTLGISAGLIYLRGYLIPGTPTLTKRYLPLSVLRLFGKEPEPTANSGFGAVGPQQHETATGEQTHKSTNSVVTSPSSGNAGSDGRSTDYSAKEGEFSIVPEEFLSEQDIVEPCTDVDDLCLTEPFKNEWNNEIDKTDAESLNAEDAAVAVGLTDDEANFEFQHQDDAHVLRRDDRHIGQWPSQAALVADVTAARVLNSWTDEWRSLPVKQKGALLNGLRLFLETCPTSDGEVTMGQETVESCCRSHDVLAVTCEETGERLFEHRVSEFES